METLRCLGCRSRSCRPAHRGCARHPRRRRLDDDRDRLGAINHRCACRGVARSGTKSARPHGVRRWRWITLAHGSSPCCGMGRPRAYRTPTRSTEPDYRRRIATCRRRCGRFVTGHCSRRPACPRRCEHQRNGADKRTYSWSRLRDHTVGRNSHRHRTSNAGDRGPRRPAARPRRHGRTPINQGLDRTRPSGRAATRRAGFRADDRVTRSRARRLAHRRTRRRADSSTHIPRGPRRRRVDRRARRPRGATHGPGRPAQPGGHRCARAGRPTRRDAG